MPYQHSPNTPGQDVSAGALGMAVNWVFIRPARGIAGQTANVTIP
jgi:hypothetical protein